MKPTTSLRRFARWLLVAFAIRLVASYTHRMWAFPDEWYQSIEFANLFVNGAAAYVQEINLHLRNLTYPFLLTAPLRLARAAAPGDVGLRVFFAQLLTGVLDLVVVWGWWRMTEAYQRRAGKRLDSTALNLGFGLLILPWFAVGDSVRMSSEHLSSIAFWGALGLMADEYWFAAGIVALAIAAFRYPSALLTAGLALGIGLRALLSGDRRPFVRFAAGLALGLALFGIPDWIVYGRPWESAWMYLQYNVLTGLGTQKFGTQSAFEYWRYFSNHWHWVLIPDGCVLAVAACIGTFRALRRLEPWALAAAAYLMGHLMIGHKEARFMFPLEPILIWSAYEALVNVNARGKWPKRLQYAQSTAAASLFANLFFMVRPLFGDVFTINGTYYAVSSLLRSNPAVCAVVAAREVPDVLLPRVPLGEVRPDEPGLTWLDAVPKCSEAQLALVHSARPDPALEAQGCELQATGVLALAPRSRWPWMVKERAVKGPWYRCPARALTRYSPQYLVERTVAAFPRLEHIPGVKAGPGDLSRMVEERRKVPVRFTLSPQAVSR